MYCKYFAQRGMDNRPQTAHDLVSIEVDVHPVIDLTEADNGIVDPAAAFLAGASPEDYEQCRTLADDLRAAGFVAAIVPSAASPGENTLVIYIDGPAQQIALDQGPDRSRIKGSSLSRGCPNCPIRLWRVGPMRVSRVETRISRRKRGCLRAAK